MSTLLQARTALHAISTLLAFLQDVQAVVQTLQCSCILLSAFEAGGEELHEFFPEGFLVVVLLLMLFTTFQNLLENAFEMRFQELSRNAFSIGHFNNIFSKAISTRSFQKIFQQGPFKNFKCRTCLLKLRFKTSIHVGCLAQCHVLHLLA